VNERLAKESSFEESVKGSRNHDLLELIKWSNETIKIENKFRWTLKLKDMWGITEEIQRTKKKIILIPFWQKCVKMPFYEPVARYHVSSSNSPDYSEDEIEIEVEEELEIDERQSFISYRGVGTRRVPASHGRIHFIHNFTILFLKSLKVLIISYLFF
jgi:hypothetical protein